MVHNLQSNIWKFTVFSITNKRTYMTLFSIYLLTLPGATEQTIGLVTFLSSLATFIFEVPSGYFSDKFGHRNTLIISRIIIVASTLSLVLANKIWMMILSSILLSIAWAFTSGTNSAFMHETLRDLGREDQYAKIMGSIKSIGFAVPIVFIVLIPFLQSISYQFAFSVTLLTDIVGLLVAISFVKPHVAPEKIKEIGATNFSQVLREGYRLHYLRYALYGMLFVGIMLGIAPFRTPYQELIGIPVIYFGILWGLSRVVISLCSLTNGWVKRNVRFHTYLWVNLILYVILIGSLGFVRHVWVIAGIFILTSGLYFGFSSVAAAYKLEIIASSNFKATLISVQRLGESIIRAIAALVIGVIITQGSYAQGYLITALMLLVVIIPLLIYLEYTKQPLVEKGIRV